MNYLYVENKQHLLTLNVKLSLDRRNVKKNVIPEPTLKR